MGESQSSRRRSPYTCMSKLDVLCYIVMILALSISEEGLTLILLHSTCNKPLVNVQCT